MDTFDFLEKTNGLIASSLSSLLPLAKLYYYKKRRSFPLTPVKEKFVPTQQSVLAYHDFSWFREYLNIFVVRHKVSAKACVVGTTN